MKVIADFHIHSRYSRATSKNMDLIEISRFCKIKGLNLIGTGDFTHPKWLNELKEGLTEIDGSGLYRLSHNEKDPTLFMISGEVCTIFTRNEKSHRIHHVILAPSLDNAEQISDALKKYGNLDVDGRPFLNMNAAHLVEIISELSSQNVIFPAHAWTPWYGVFGSISGFDSLEDCYEDFSHKIFALETGLSSDPLMNWRISDLDNLALLSNSDSHSAWPWRIGREANVFELNKLTYREIINSIESKNDNFLFTIETNPAYGKYHWTGHRNCGISFSAKDAMSRGSVCPICRKKLTKGVEQRVEEMANREIGYRPTNAKNFFHLLPLSEIIAFILGKEQLASPKIWEVYNSLIEKFGNEYFVLLNAKKDDIEMVAGKEIADTIIGIREGRMRVEPGYDGLYGKLKKIDSLNEQTTKEAKKITNLDDYFK